MRTWLPLLSCVVVLGGCVAPAPSGTLDEESQGAERFHVVVGLVDEGVNPYHELFADPAASLPATIVDAVRGEPPRVLQLSTKGSLADRIEEDQATWAGVQPGVLYWIAGTRLLAISLDPATEGVPPLMDSESTLHHGTAVASVVRQVSRESWIVMVRTSGELLQGNVTDPLAPLHGVQAGFAWLAAQPWVDTISISKGLAVEPPLLWEHIGLTRASQEAAEAGLLIVASAGNLPTTNLQSGKDGPPWVITVGGVQAQQHGDEPLASKAVDVVADYTRLVGAGEPDAYREVSGTSFSAPLVAGNLAQAILTLRSAAGHVGGIRDGALCACGGAAVTSKEVRAALNASAEYWALAEWSPGNGTFDEPLDVVFEPTLPIIPAPWVQMGWGYVGEGTWRTMVAALQGQPPAPKPAEAQAYMAAQHALREAYWAAVPAGR